MQLISKITLMAITFYLLTGCSYRSSNFFENIIADNETIKADGRYSGSVGATPKAPIVKTINKSKTIDNIKDIPSSKRIISKGKFVQSNFDKDYNLYVYTFVDELSHKPITFFYDKSIHYDKMTRYEIIVDGNYLYKIVKVNSKSQLKSSKPIIESPKRRPRKYKKRRRSFLKAPIEEKINTL